MNLAYGKSGMFSLLLFLKVVVVFFVCVCVVIVVVTCLFSRLRRNCAHKLSNE